MATGDAADVQAKFLDLASRSSVAGSFVQRAIELRDAGIVFDPAVVVASEQGAQSAAKALLALDLTAAWWTAFLATLDARFGGAAAANVVKVILSTYTVAADVDVVDATFGGPTTITIPSSLLTAGRPIIVRGAQGGLYPVTVDTKGLTEVGDNSAVINWNGGWVKAVPNAAKTSWLLFSVNDSRYTPQAVSCVQVNAATFTPDIKTTHLYVTYTVNGAVTITLPAALFAKKQPIVIMDGGSATSVRKITIVGEAPNTVQGTCEITTGGGCKTLVPNDYLTAWSWY